VLSETYALHDVRDIEALCWQVAHKYCQSIQSYLEPADVEDLVAFLLVEAWKASERYSPITQTARFSSYARRILGARCVDWYRLRFGRTVWKWSDGREYRRERRVVLSLNAPRGANNEGTLGESLRSQPGDGPPDRLEDPLWIHDCGDQSRLADTAILRAESRRRARVRAERKRAERG
jgi:DNA-directed RNA polymerase specialized sigma24 family protein